MSIEQGDSDTILESLGIGAIKAIKKQQLKEDFEKATKRTPKSRSRKISFEEEPLETINEEESFWSEDGADATTISSEPKKMEGTPNLSELFDPEPRSHGSLPLLKPTSNARNIFLRQRKPIRTTH